MANGLRQGQDLVTATPVPEGDLVLSTSVPETTTVDPVEQDIEVTRQTRAAFPRGVRAGFNQIGALGSGLAGNIAETMGLTDFAATRFSDAEQFAEFADAVGPEVKDYRQVKDLNTLAQFVSGTAGQVLPQFLPSVAGGVAGARLGLRGAFGGATQAARARRGALAGAATGAFPLTAGEQAIRLRGEPGETTPAERTAGAFGVGTINAALEAILPGGAAARLVRPGARAAGSVARDVGRAIATEAATETAQEAVGQAGAGLQVPGRETAEDVPELIQAGLTGAIGGAVLGGGARVSEGALARLRRALGDRQRPTDEDDLGDVLDRSDLTEDELVDEIGRREEATNRELREAFPDEDLSDPLRREELKGELRARFDREVVAPRAQTALRGLERAVGEAAGAPERGDRPSLQRTKVDAAVLDHVTDSLRPELARSMTSEQRRDLAAFVKHFAQSGFMERKELAGVASAAEAMPPELLHFFGRDTAGVVQRANEILERAGVAPRREFEPALREAGRRLRQRRSAMESAIMEHLKPEIFSDPEQRRVAIEGFQRLLSDVSTEPGEIRALTEFATREGAPERQRLSAQGQRVMEAAGLMFENRPAAMKAIEEATAAERPEFHLTEEEAREFGLAEEPEEMGEDISADPRVGTHATLEQATRAARDLAAETDPKAVRFEVHEELDVNEQGQVQPTGRYFVEAKDAEGTDALSPEAFSRIRNVGGQSGFENGVITVTTKSRPSGVPVSIPRLTAEAARTTRGQEGDVESRVPYQARIVLRGLGMLLGDRNVTGLGKKTKEEIGDSPEAFDLPDNTLVGRFGGKFIRWGEVKAMLKADPEELRRARLSERAEEAAQQAESVNDIETSIKPFVEERIKQLKALMDSAPGQPRRLRNGQMTKGSEQFRAAKRDHARMVQTLERIDAEIDRRETEGDAPIGEIGAPRSEPVERKAEAVTLRTQEPEGERLVQEETGLPLQGPPGPARGRPFQPFETGIREEERAPAPVKVTKPALTETQVSGLLRRLEEMTPQEWQSFRSRVENSDNVQSLTDTVKFLENLDESGLSEKVIERAGDLQQAAADRLFDVGKAALADSIGPTGRRDVLSIEAERKLRDAVARGEVHKLLKKSDIRDGTKPLTSEQKRAATEFVRKVLGPDADVLFKNMAAAGEFAELDGVETLRISNWALDHMGAARHEAAHALFARLIRANKQAAQQLLAAAGSPHIVQRLRSLLKDHPDALRQLSDPEERVAYMYQFWAAGELQVGPKTKTWFDKVRTFFRALSGFWSETFSEQVNAARAEAIFAVFDRGELANRDTVAQVLREKAPKPAFDRATEVMGPLWKWFEKAFYTSITQVHQMNIPAFNGVADKFFVPLGREGLEPGYHQTKHATTNRFLTKFHAALAGTTEAQQREAIENLQLGKAGGKVEAGVRSVLREAFDYMKEKGVKAVVWNDKTKKYDELDVQFVANYFPRMYDRAAIVENRLAFVDMLRKHTGMSNKEAAAVTDSITRPQAATDENDEQVGLTFYAPNTLSRKLDVPPEALSPFLVKDLNTVMSMYLTHVARRGEYASRFGNQGQEIAKAVKLAEAEQGATPEQVQRFGRIVQSLEGSIGHQINPRLKGIMSAATTYQNVRLLPLALFSSLVDFLGIAVRGGGATQSFKAFARGIRDLAKQARDEGVDLAETVGTVARAHEAHIIADAYGSQFMSPQLRKFNELFFKYIGLESWNRSMRVQATVAAEQFLIRHATKPNQHSERYFRELNLAKDDVKIADGHVVLNDKIRGAISMWVDGAVLRPNASIRPVWMSDPHWQLVSHLKQFPFSFQKTIIARVVNEMQNGNFTPAYWLVSYVPAIIAADFARAALTPGGGDDDALERLGAGGIIARGVQRAGLFGPSEFALAAYGDLGHAKPPLVSLSGPTLQQAFDLLSAAAGSGDLGREAARAIPGYTLVR